MILKTLKVHRGFSIIELTIVIILMGLLSIAILTGTQLIKEAQIRSLIESITQYEKAVQQFRVIYSYLPGDFLHVETWSEIDVAESCYRIDANGNVNGADGKQVPDYALIRGDGDGFIYYTDYSRVNCHLVLAGILPKQDNVGRGIFDQGAKIDELGAPVALPSRKYTETYFIDNVNIISAHGQISIILNAQPQRNPPEKPFKYLNAYQAKNFHARIKSHILQAIDKKIDDGRPGDGKIIFASRNVTPNYPSTGKFQNNGNSWGHNGYDAYEKFCTSTIDPLNSNACAPGSTFSYPGSKNLNSAFLVYGTN